MQLYAHQRITADFLETHPRAFNTSDPGCVSADTEFLTPTGWKRIDQYTPGDKVCQFNAETRTASFVEPSDYIVKNCEEMIVFAPTRGSKQKLSGEHRVLFQPHGTNKLEVLTAGEIERLHRDKPNGFSGKVLNTFKLENNSAIPLSEFELRLMVACIADGYFPNGIPRCYIRLKKERKKTRLREILQAAGVEYVEKPCAPEGFTQFSFLAPRKDKSFGSYYWNASNEQLKIIVDEAEYWDGSRDTRTNTCYRFSSYSKDSADFIQFAAAATGRTTACSVQTRHRRNAVETGYEVRVHNRAITNKLTGRYQESVYREATEDGKKYCFTVPDTFWVMRYKGYVSITGNTGKTASSLEGYRRTRQGKLLVIAPLSILKPSWGDDIEKFTQFNYGIAHGTPEKRRRVLTGNYDIVVTNTDAVKWIAKHPEDLEGFSHLVIDEFTAFKNRESQRSKALAVLTRAIPHVWMLSGTPNSNTILDIWYPAFLLDNGQRLGKKFWQFRSQVCEAVQVGPSIKHIQWRDKEGVENDVADLLRDITVRFAFEECIDIPEHAVHDMQLEMPKWLSDHYNYFLENDFLETENGVVTALHAGTRVKKALQLLSGAIYDSGGTAVKVHDERYNLVCDLIQERKQCVVAFNYRHERDQLTTLFKKQGISYGVIDGSVGTTQRTEHVTAFQAGELKVILAQPASASHGLTLTKGTTTIWCSPTYNAEHYQQFNRRIYRAGQKHKTETIRIAYAGSEEVKVYDKLDGKLERMEDLLELFQHYTHAEAG